MASTNEKAEERDAAEAGRLLLEQMEYQAQQAEMDARELPARLRRQLRAMMYRAAFEAAQRAYLESGVAPIGRPPATPTKDPR